MLRVSMKLCAAGGAGVFALLLAACGAKPAPTASPSGSPSASPSASAEADASAKVMVAYQGYLKTYIEAGHTADYQNQALRQFIGDPLLMNVQYDLEQMNKNGLIRTGDVSSSPVVTSVQLNTPVKTVIIADCVDTSNWHTVDKVTGKSADVPGQATRHKETAEAIQYDDGRWLVRKITTDKSATC